jgi:hypothetical protein
MTHLKQRRHDWRRSRPGGPRYIASTLVMEESWGNVKLGARIGAGMKTRASNFIAT